MFRFEPSRLDKLAQGSPSLLLSYGRDNLGAQPDFVALGQNLMPLLNALLVMQMLLEYMLLQPFNPLLASLGGVFFPLL